MKKGEICIVRFTGGEGREQEGIRPAIFLAETKTRIVIVAPLTSNLGAKKFPFTLFLQSAEQSGLEYPSVALLFHMRAIDKSRMGSILGKMKKDDMEQMNIIIRKMFQLK